MKKLEQRMSLEHTVSLELKPKRLLKLADKGQPSKSTQFSYQLTQTQFINVCTESELSGDKMLFSAEHDFVKNNPTRYNEILRGTRLICSVRGFVC